MERTDKINEERQIYNEMAQNETATCASTISRKKEMRRALSSLTNVVSIHHNYRNVNKPLPCKFNTNDDIVLPCKYVQGIKQSVCLSSSLGTKIARSENLGN